MGGNMLVVLLVGALGATLMVIGARLAGIEEMNAIVRAARARIIRRRSGTL
jgi:hypothetical protein